MADSTAPTPPTLHARAISPIGVKLWWEGATDAVGVASYTVYRDTVAVKTGITSTEYIDGALTASTEYRFEVTAVDAASNESNKSNIRRVTTQAASVQAAATSTTASPEPTLPGRCEIDFGSTPVHGADFTITDSSITPRCRIVAQVAYEKPTGGVEDEASFDKFHLICKAGTGSFVLSASLDNDYLVSGKYKINYHVVY
jgi:hypothetical protein